MSTGENAHTIQGLKVRIITHTSSSAIKEKPFQAHVCTPAK